MDQEELKVDSPVIEKKDEEISLIDLLAVVWKRKWIIIGITLAGAIFSVAYAFISIKLPPEKSYLPNLYKPQAQMLINDAKGSSSSLSSALSASGLAGMMGVSGLSSGGSNSALAKYLVTSNATLDAIVKEFGILENMTEAKSPIASSRAMIKGKFTISYDDSTSVFTIAFEDKDPEFARDVINFTVELLEKRFAEIGVDQNLLKKSNLEENIRNSYDEILKIQMQIQDLEHSVSNVYNPNYTPSIIMDTSLLKMELNVQEQIYAGLKSQYESLKVSMASEKPVFQVLEYAEIPDKKSGPGRGKLCIIYTFAALFGSVFLVFVIEAIQNLLKDPVAMAKLKKNKK